MSTISTFRFSLWVVMVCGGVGLLLTDRILAAILMLGLSGLVFISRANLRQPVPAGQATLLMILPMALLGLGLLGAWRLSEPVWESMMTHPALVIPLWLAVLLLVYCQWRNDRRRLLGNG